eukprot:4979304-Ditylum_brightwellii.AAC.1
MTKHASAAIPRHLHTPKPFPLSSLHSNFERCIYPQGCCRWPTPFPFQCHSTGKALSIQAHPNKTGAKRLHDKDPTNYRGTNHKPEMAIALIPFEAMCIIRPLEEIAILIKKHSEFAVCILEAANQAVFLAYDEDLGCSALKAVFSSFMNSSSITNWRVWVHERKKCHVT